MEGGVWGGSSQRGGTSCVGIEYGGVTGGSMVVGGVICGGLFLPLINDASIDNITKIRIATPAQIPIVLKSNFAGLSVTMSIGSGLFCGEAEGEAVYFANVTICGVGFVLDLGLVEALVVGFTVAVHPQVKLVGQSGFLQNPE